MTKTKNNAQCFSNLHNLSHKPSSFIYRCSSHMAKYINNNILLLLLILALLYLIIHCRPRFFLSTLMRVICFARMTHGFLLNCPTVKIGGGGGMCPSGRYSYAREKRHLGFRQVWACLSAVSVPVLLQFTATRSTSTVFSRLYFQSSFGNNFPKENWKCSQSLGYHVL
jgi:hypothetical protein